MQSFKNILPLLILPLLLHAGFLLHYRFEDSDATIMDSGPAKCHGLYTPAADKDNDTPETNDPKRYHQKTPVGHALGFFPELASYATISATPFPQAMEELHLRLNCKVGERSIQYLVGNKTDSANTGFSLMRWGAVWRFQYGDGQASYKVEGPARPLDAYLNLYVDFVKGNVTLRENGHIVAQAQTSGQTIAASALPLTIGNYPTSNKTVYAAQCFMDELEIADAPLESEEAVAKETPPPIRCICEPVEGNEPNFNGQKVLHSFRDSPVAATWIIDYDKEADINPSLEWELPDGVTIPMAFRSTRNSNHKRYPLVREGHIVRIPHGEFTEDRTPEEITLVFETSRDTTIRWRMRNGDVVVREDAFELLLLPPMPPLPPGRFHSHAFMLSDIAFEDTALRDRVAATYVRSGLIGKGRYYERYPEQHPIDERLRDRHGFILWEVSLWGGPFRHLDTYPDVPAAVSADGKAMDMLCLRALVRNEAARAAYFQEVKKTLLPSKAVVLDFEPWGMPSKGCFCAECIAAFNERFGLSCADAAQIKGEHASKWAVFWTELTARYIQLMADAARAALPNVEVWDYTYVFPYDDEAALQARWRSIPKDPRLNENHLDGSMLSLYHINGRKAYEAYDLSRQHLSKQLCPISFISRHNTHLGSYTNPEDVLSPRQIYLKAVMSGALGAEIFGIYPGSWIDGAFHVALNQATTEVRNHESYYLDGKRRRDLAVTSAAPAEAWVATVHERADGQRLATVINFSTSPINVQLPETADTLAVPAESVGYKTWKPLVIKN